MEPVQHQLLLRDGAWLSSTTATMSQRTVRTLLYPPIKSNKPLLRVGIMLDDWKVPAWVADVLRNIQDSGVAVLTTVIFNRETRAEASSWAETLKGTLSAKSVAFGTQLWDRYVRSDQRLKSQFATPFHKTDVRSLLAAARVIDVVPLRNGSVHQLNQADIAAIKYDRLDVLVRFGFKILGGDILSAATYGVWSYHHADNNQYPGAPAGFWEMYERNPLTGTILEILSEDLDRSRIIYRTYGATRSFESLVENRYWLFRKAIPFVTRCLRRVYVHGPAGIRPEERAPACTRRYYRTPRNRHMLRLLLRIQWMHFVVRIQNLLKIQPDHWFLALAHGVAPGQQLAGKVAALHPPRGHLWADPMLVRSNGRVFLFFEDYEYSLRRGHISVVEIYVGGRVGAPRIALQANHHLSYPFVFEWQGTHYMVPETMSVGAVQLYRSVEFPTRWEYVQDLLTDIRAVDATLCEHTGHWYLFAAVSEAGGSTWDELFLFIADTPLGPWVPHPMNPIVSDVRGARPGGALFRRNGVLYRPAQNSAKTYGRSLVVMEVTELAPDRYAERLAYRIEPDWLPNIYGCHTITTADDLVALDCKTFKWRARARERPGVFRKLAECLKQA